jgi:hypothetical protein
MSRIAFAVRVSQLLLIFAAWAVSLFIVVNSETYGEPWHNTSTRYGNELCFGAEDSGSCVRMTWHGAVMRYSNPD